MKKIPVGRKNYALVDDEDFDFLDQWQWAFSGHNKTTLRGYAMRQENKCKIYMHHLLMKPEERMVVDHKNGNSLDNRKENLRICTHQQNNMNRRPHSATGLKGVCWDTQAHKWHATMGLDGVKIHLGYYMSKYNAALAYSLISRIYYGEFAFASRSADNSTSN